MNLESFDSPLDFLKAVERHLARREAEHHLMLGVAHDLAAKRSESRPTLFATLRNEEGLALAALMTQSRPLVLATDLGDASAAIESLLGWLLSQATVPREVIADVTHAQAFGDAWRRATGGAAEVRMRQRLYILRAIGAVRIGPGSLRRATSDDLDLLERWTGGFKEEAMGTPADPELRERLERRIQLGEIFLWEDGGGEPRSMAASARPTRRGIAINSVYTPREWRRRGYASSCVAKLSELLLSQGREFCVLYTDLANPTSNAIYQRLGYRPVSDSVMLAIK